MKKILVILDKTQPMTKDELYMLRCLELAQKGKTHVKPNPMVGCVIVKEEKIIGEGYHRKYGEAHAEVNAINSVTDVELLKSSTLYVNLEPCAHHGKTPPCSDLIIRMGIPKVVIGCIDSFSKVAGKGIEKMQKSGIEVHVGVLESESRNLNRAFFTFHEKKRPYIILKWAQTLDGFMDVVRKPEDPIGVNWITHPNLKMPVHKWRSEEMAIMVGAGTAINDNPQLDTREWFGKNPLRILFSEAEKIGSHFNLLDGSTPTLIFTNKPLPFELNKDTQLQILDFSQNPLSQMLNYLYQNEIQSVMVEGGKALLESMIEMNLWDEARVLIGDKTFGAGLKAPALPQKHYLNCRYLKDTILHYYNLDFK